MSDLNPEFVERYQILLEQDPMSKVFAPLAEAYRKMGLHQEALQICLQGVQHHPDFSGGRVALAKVLIDQGDIETAVEHLQVAAQHAPENILAQLLLGECLYKLKKPKEALKAYKMVLFLNPTHERALKTVKKLESLTADEYEDEVFAVRKIKGEVATPLSPMKKDTSIRNLDRFVSLADAFLIRNDLERAQEVLFEAQQTLGDHPEILRRLKLWTMRTQGDPVIDSRPPGPTPPREVVMAPLDRDERARQAKLVFLKGLLSRIQARTLT